MALQKTIVTETGATGNYVKVEGIEYAFNQMMPARCTVVYSLFLNQDTRRADKQPLSRNMVRLDPTVITEANVDFVNPKAMIYEILKTLPEFADAIDC